MAVKPIDWSKVETKLPGGDLPCPLILREDQYPILKRMLDEAEQRGRLEALKERDMAIKVAGDNALELFNLYCESRELVEALKGLTNAALADLKPLPSQVEFAFNILKKVAKCDT